MIGHQRGAIDSVLPMIVLLALYAARLSRPRWHAPTMSLTQAIEAKPRKEPCDEGAGARWPQPPPLALAIEAEWRKHAAGVVPAQPKARPKGQRPIGTPLAPHPDFPTVPQVERTHSGWLPHHPWARASSCRPEHEPQSIFLTKLLLFWSRPTASAPRRRRAPRQRSRISVARLQRKSHRGSRRGPARNRPRRRARQRSSPR
jgi:hypothetical protein